MFTTAARQPLGLTKIFVVAAIALAALVAQTLWLERVVSEPIVSALVAIQPTGRPAFFEDIVVRPTARSYLLATSDAPVCSMAE